MGKKDRVSPEQQIANQISQAAEGHNIKIELTPVNIQLLRNLAAKYYTIKNVNPGYAHGFNTNEIMEYINDRCIDAQIIETVNDKELKYYILECRGLLDNCLLDSSVKIPKESKN